MTILPVNWVTVQRFCELTGYTVDAVDKKRSGGMWLQGTVWKTAPDGRVLISIAGYEAWVEERECAPQAHRVSASRSNITVRGAVRN